VELGPELPRNKRRVYFRFMGGPSSSLNLHCGCVHCPMTYSRENWPLKYSVNQRYITEQYVGTVEHSNWMLPRLPFPIASRESLVVLDQAKPRVPSGVLGLVEIELIKSSSVWLLKDICCMDANWGLLRCWPLESNGQVSILA